jgi:GDPmannose 4,6-dehydratase
VKALISGITGQDGSYLAELLDRWGYDVHGIIRRSSSFNTGRIDHIFDRLTLHYGDLTDASSIRHVLETVRPDWVFNLGAQSHVRVSFDIPEYTADVGALGTLRLLEAIRDVNPRIRFYQASSSEMFGGILCPPGGYTEESPFDPRSPYAAAKVFSFHVTRNYRDAYGLHASNGILFNHESPRRGETFVTRKITRGIARIAAGKQDHIKLGNLLAYRDWGHAKDYVQAMKMIMEHPEPGDYVIATGTTHTVADFLAEACRLAGFNVEDVMRFDSKYLRPTEVPFLLGNPAKAWEILGWTPSVSFPELVRDMMEADFKLEGIELCK